MASWGFNLPWTQGSPFGAAAQPVFDTRPLLPTFNPRSAPPPADPTVAEFGTLEDNFNQSVEDLLQAVDEVVRIRGKILGTHPTKEERILARLQSQGKAITACHGLLDQMEGDLSSMNTFQRNVRAASKQSRIKSEMLVASQLKKHVVDDKIHYRETVEHLHELAFQEQINREHTRAWMAYHAREREGDLEASEIDRILREAELGSKDGLIEADMGDGVTYRKLWLAANPMTELSMHAERLRFIEDGFDDFIKQQMSGGEKKKTAAQSPSRVTKGRKGGAAKSSRGLTKLNTAAIGVAVAALLALVLWLVLWRDATPAPPREPDDFVLSQPAALDTPLAPAAWNTDIASRHPTSSLAGAASAYTAEAGSSASAYTSELGGSLSSYTAEAGNSLAVASSQASAVAAITNIW